MKCIGINITKDVHNQNKNYKTLLRKIKEDLNKWRDIPCSWIGGLNIVMMSILPKFICRASVIKINIKASFHFYRSWQAHSKFTRNYKRSRKAKTALKKNKVKGLTLSDFKINLYHKAIMIKNVCISIKLDEQTHYIHVDIWFLIQVQKSGERNVFDR